MATYIYTYHTIVRFSSRVSRHSVLMRPVVRPGNSVKVVREELVVSPGLSLSEDMDPFGNRVLRGEMSSAHDTLEVLSTGLVTTDVPQGEGDDTWVPLEAFRHPTPLTSLSGMAEGEDMDAYSLCLHSSRLLEYLPGATSVDTTASEALARGQGVCQDFSHLMLGLCRLRGLPARYVVGFIEGCGETHAWVEVWEDGAWHGYDPTHGSKVEDGYVPLCVGRDARDCPVMRGTYYGLAEESRQVTVTLTHC